MKIDDYGRVRLNADEIFDALFRGDDLGGIYAYGDAVSKYNEYVRHYDKPAMILADAPDLSISPEAYHRQRVTRWSYPEQYDEMDLWGELEARCSNDVERNRLRLERTEYETRELVPVLRLMMFLVDDFRSRDVLWGVGRGSSVASFVLYLIGITKINPIVHGLEIGEFLK